MRIRRLLVDSPFAQDALSVTLASLATATVESDDAENADDTSSDINSRSRLGRGRNVLVVSVPLWMGVVWA